MHPWDGPAEHMKGKSLCWWKVHTPHREPHSGISLPQAGGTAWAPLLCRRLLPVRQLKLGTGKTPPLPRPGHLDAFGALHMKSKLRSCQR